MRGANVAHIRFRNVKLPPENLVGRKSQGLDILLDELDRERLVGSAEMLGIARAAYEAALEYSNKREQFGRPIREFQAISLLIADMAVQLEASRLLILRSRRLSDVRR